MKKTAYYYLSLVTLLTGGLVSCQDYEAGYTASDLAYAKYQTYKLDCVNEELAKATNYYGMGGTVATRTTDGGIYQHWNDMYYAYTHNTLTEATEVHDKYWVLIFNENVTCTQNNHNNDWKVDNGHIDMAGFNTSDPQGKCVFIPWSEEKPNCSNCSNNVHTLNDYQFKYKTDGHYLFVEIWAKDYLKPNENTGKKYEYVLAKVYVTLDYNPAKDYLLCIEDLGGPCLDFNDCVILGGENKKPRVIYRMADYSLTITTSEGSYTLEANQYGDQDIELPFNNMNTPSSWQNVHFVADGRIDFTPTLNSAADMPTVIATDVTYEFHREEDSMTNEEFPRIPYFNRTN